MEGEMHHHLQSAPQGADSGQFVREREGMTKGEFVQSLEEMLELPGGALHVELELFSVPGWDSLQMLAFIAMCERSLGVVVDGTKVGNARKVSDLVALIADRLEEV
jgi:acyl carrier protein